MKNNKYLFLAMMMCLITLMWTVMYKNSGSDRIKYDEYISKAQEHEDKKAYLTAAKFCTYALELYPDDDVLMLRTADDYLMCEDSQDFMRYCSMAMAKNPRNPESYLKMSQYYESQNDYKKAIDILKSASKTIHGGEIDDRLAQIKYTFEESGSVYSDMCGFFNGFSTAMNDRGKWGVVGENANVRLPFKYDQTGGAYNGEEDIISVCLDGEWFMCDLKGRKKYVPDTDYSFLGTYADGYCPFEFNGLYGYMDLEYKEYNCGYEFAGAFNNKIAAVCKDGKWALINNKFENITGFEYDNIKTDRYGMCNAAGTVTAQKNGKYYEIDSKGNEKEIDADQADIVDGNCGLSVCMSEGKYGYCSKEGGMKIEAQYEQATPFSKNGAACVKKDGIWSVIQLYEYE